MITILALALVAASAGGDPSPAASAIDAERAFAARAQTDGQWTAFRATAAPDAIMLAPDPINAHQFLARFKKDPAVAVMWWPARSWVSCDGSLAVTTGPWVRNGGTKVGTFTTVWRREADGSWRWVYDNGREIPQAIEAPDEPLIIRPACLGKPAGGMPPGEGMWLQREGRMPGEWDLPIEPVPSAKSAASGRSADGTLRWELHHRPEHGPHAYMFQLWQRSGRREPSTPQAVGAAPAPDVSERMVAVEAHGFTQEPPE